MHDCLFHAALVSSSSEAAEAAAAAAAAVAAAAAASAMPGDMDCRECSACRMLSAAHVCSGVRYSLVIIVRACADFSFSVEE